MKIALGGDHAGFKYKDQIIEFVKSLGHETEDFGPYSDDSVDYPDFVHPTVESILGGDSDLGILICGSGNGVAMTANKHSGIRAAICWNTDLAALSRQHNDANVICIGSRFVSLELTKEMIEIFLSTDFEGGRHLTRVNKINC